MGDARDEGGAQESVLLPVAQGAATNPRTTPHASVEMIRSSRRMRAAGSRLLGEGTGVAGGRVGWGGGTNAPVGASGASARSVREGLSADSREGKRLNRMAGVYLWRH